MQTPNCHNLPLKQESFPSEQAKKLAGDSDANFVVQPSIAAHGADAAIDEALRISHSAKHQSKAAQVKPEHAHWVNHEVHCKSMAGVLGAAQTGFHHCEAALHEHDQEARDERPGEVDRYAVVTDRIRKLNGQRFGLGFGRVIVKRLLGVVVRLHLGRILLVIRAQIRRCAHHKMVTASVLHIARATSSHPRTGPASDRQLAHIPPSHHPPWRSAQ